MDDSYDFGYALRKEFWHKGLVTEASRAVVAQLMKDGVPYITATHDKNNPRSGGVMKQLGMKYQYSYEEQWQPKNIPVIFRMYQLNLDGDQTRVYRKYWDHSVVHFIEMCIRDSDWTGPWDYTSNNPNLRDWRPGYPKIKSLQSPKPAANQTRESLQMCIRDRLYTFGESV